MGKKKDRAAVKEYLEIRSKVLRRDRWRCQGCGAKTRLDVHHQQFRSHGGGDDLSNLITLCRVCHQKQHSTRADNE